MTLKRSKTTLNVCASWAYSMDTLTRRCGAQIMIDKSKMLSLVSELAKVKSEQDTLAALAIYHSEIELVSPSFNALATGSEQVEQQLKVFFSLFPDYEVSIEQQAVNEDVLLATGQVWVTPNIPGKECSRIQLPVFIEFHFRDKRISKEVFYLDAGMVCKKAGITPQDLTNATRAILAEKTAS